MAYNLWPVLRWLFAPAASARWPRWWPRWLFLRALGLIFLSAFYSWSRQVRGLMGPQGILPVTDYLGMLAPLGAQKYWYAPSLFWFGSGDAALSLACGVGLAASVLLILNFWPRASTAVCLVTYMSLVTVAQDFSGYQSDGMLLAAAFICLFLAPAGIRPGLGEGQPPSRASYFLLQWLWFRIYFESGFVKLASHDPEWRHLTALDQYYQNGPLPNWIGWYAQQLPHWFQATVTLATLSVELGAVWMMFLPRRARIFCFLLVTPFQLGIILTANLAFINHLALCLGILLVDDAFLHSVVRYTGIARLRGLVAPWFKRSPALQEDAGGMEAAAPAATWWREFLKSGLTTVRGFREAGLITSAICLSWVFYVTSALLVGMIFPLLPLPQSPISAAAPMRIANEYGLFAVMTTARYEIEFQGSRDGQTWVAYPFRYKPQNPAEAPRIYAPFQPRFDWNLWFASLGGWRENMFVLRTEKLLLENDPAVLSLFAGNPFAGSPPQQVRAVMWQYWFTDIAMKRKTGMWWRRKFLGLYAPTLELTPDGKVMVVELPQPGVGGNPQ
jgi:Lipase maturation factor